MHIYKPYPAQTLACSRIVAGKPTAILLPIGYGKTIPVLTAISVLKCLGRIEKTLIISTIPIIENTWISEAKKWGHTTDLTFCNIRDNKKSWKQIEADIYLLNFDNINWLYDNLNGEFPFSLVIFDESHNMGNTKSVRFRRMKSILREYKETKRVIMSGEPIPNSFVELYSQFFLLDNGKTLGETKSAYLERYFKTVDREGRVFVPKNQACKQQILNKIAPLSISTDKGNTKYAVKYITHEAALPKTALRQYQKMENELFFELEGEGVTAFNAPAKMQKIHQLIQGFVYSDSGQTLFLHRAKLDVLESILTPDKPTIIAVGYRAEAMLYQDYFNCPAIFGGSKHNRKTIRDFVSGNTPVLIINPKSLSEGIDGFQFVCNTIIWPYITFSYRDFSQLNGRLARHGQHRDITVHSIIAPNTLDTIIQKVLGNKSSSNKELLDYVREYCKHKQTPEKK